MGQYAIQLAKLSGLKVATTASEARWPLLKTLGADLTVDYKVCLNIYTWIDCLLNRNVGPGRGKEAERRNK